MSSGGKVLQQKNSKVGLELQPIIYHRDQHPISRTNIDEDALRIMYRLAREGYKGYLVGGGVRDLLLKKKPKDFDIATDATPRQIKALFRNSRIIGRRFKLVHAYFPGGKIIEISTFRDIYDALENEQDNDSLSPIVTDNIYGTESTDAVRRDITINALFYDISTFSIIDYVGGMQDLQEKVVRVIGDPNLRYAEDPVRMIRVIRHAVRAGFSIEPSCKDSIYHNRSLIKSSSQVRVYEELKKDLCSGYFTGILLLLNETGLLEHLLPNISDKSEKLLSSESELIRSLEHIDSSMRAGRDFSAAIILAVLIYYIVNLPNKIAEEHDIDIQDITNRSLSPLTVPRKERERIAEILSGYSLLKTTQLEGRQLEYLRTNCGKELQEFLEVSHEFDLWAMAKALRTSGREARGSDRSRRRVHGRKRGRFKRDNKRQVW